MEKLFLPQPACVLDATVPSRTLDFSWFSKSERSGNPNVYKCFSRISILFDVVAQKPVSAIKEANIHTSAEFVCE